MWWLVVWTGVAGKAYQQGQGLGTSKRPYKIRGEMDVRERGGGDRTCPLSYDTFLGNTTS